ncbi:chitinase-3-like protein 1 [Haliotis cracherodii]|uniref:chitinase-3-like protein 1 n=1 Tax=Haliotis cracherodii TaxID=6455 RepID=UPI0039ECE8FE
MIPRVSLLLLPVAGGIFLALHAVQGSDLRRVCYYTNWSQYRPDKGKYTPENVNPNLCTHYVYAFATLLGNRIKAFEWNDLSTAWKRGMFERFMALKNINPSMKTLLAVGGWNLRSMPFHEMSHTPSGRKEFADSVVKFVRDNNFDGVDVDWEYPANRGGPPEDKHHYTELLQALYDAFVVEAQQSGRPRLMLTAAVAAGKPNIDTAYEIPEISRILDFISVMTYDLHGSWENHTGIHSPLYPRIDETNDDKYLNLHWAAEYWVKMGAPREKLNIGVALYGRTFTLSTADNTLGAPASGPGANGTYTREAGFLSYQEICEMEHNGGKIVDIPEQRVRYMTLGNQWVGYDNKLSLRQKVCYIKSSGFGGVMVWAVDLDDFSGADCGQGPYPLLHAIVDELATPDRTNCVGPGPHIDFHHGPATTQRPAITTRKPNTPPQVVVTNQPPITNGPIYTTSVTDFCYGLISDFYPSPHSCSAYFICVNGIAHPFTCLAGLRFNPKGKYCDRAANVPCNIAPNTAFTSKSPTISTTTTTTTSTSRSTVHPITPKPYTPIRTTQRPYTQRPSTQMPYTQMPSTQRPYTQMPSTQRPYTQRPYTPRQTTRNPTAINIGDFCQGRGNGLYRDPYICSKYYQCNMQLGFVLDCPPYTAFNELTQACDFPYKVPGC